MRHEFQITELIPLDNAITFPSKFWGNTYWPMYKAKENMTAVKKTCEATPLFVTKLQGHLKVKIDMDPPHCWTTFDLSHNNQKRIPQKVYAALL